ncbi:MAG: thioredoxin-dependent peroxiredoxin [Patescibacteria group bacterium]|nr:thioredoxin-dependent peroxiredoxin [Patescibacteria group bacterium]
MMLKLNSKAPVFSLPDQKGKVHKLSDYLGQYVLLYFYPKDDTTGCTKEACAIRDGFPDFKKLKCKVFGISVDSVESHKNFAKKYDLPFTLLSDEKKKVVERYGVWQEKSMYGRKYMGTLRDSYLVDPKGKIVKIYEKVNPVDHADEVLSDLKSFLKK